MKTLKREEIYATAYRDLDHLRSNLAVFIEESYNGTRLHSALGYQPPNEFERGLASGRRRVPPACSFFGLHRNQHREKAGRGRTAIHPKCANANLSH
jgi:hypothetical protein